MHAYDSQTERPSRPQRPDRLHLAGYLCLALGIVVFILDAVFEFEHLHPLIPPMLAVLLTTAGIATIGITYIKTPRK